MSFSAIAIIGLLSLSVQADNQKLPRKTCTIQSQWSASNGTADDTPAISKAFSRCSKGGIVQFSEGVNYNVHTPINVTLDQVEIRMFGNLHLPKNVTYMQNLVNATRAQSGDNLYWLNFSGPGISYIGTPNVTTGWIYSYGQTWWDMNPPNGTGIENRPHLTLFNLTDGTVEHLKSRQPIAWNHRLMGNNITVRGSIIDAYSENGGGFPFNTDGFQVAGTNITIIDSVINNGDDAFAIVSGAHNILIQRATVGYASHGLSIGSLGKKPASFANVSNVRFDDITMINTVYGARFKSYIGGQGLARNISWNNIRVFNVSFPIFVTQTYFNQAASAEDKEISRSNDSSVILEDLRWTNWKGTTNTFQPGDGTCVSNPCWYDLGLTNRNKTEAIIIECSSRTSCQGFEMVDIQIFPQGSADSTVICTNVAAELNPRLGFECKNGTFVPTME